MGGGEAIRGVAVPRRIDLTGGLPSLVGRRDARRRSAGAEAIAGTDFSVQTLSGSWNEGGFGTVDTGMALRVEEGRLVENMAERWRCIVDDIPV